MKRLLLLFLFASVTSFAQQDIFHKSGMYATFETITAIDSGRYILAGDIYGASLSVVDSTGSLLSCYRYIGSLQGPFDHCGFYPTADTGGILIAQGSPNSYAIKVDKDLQPQWNMSLPNTDLAYAREIPGGEIMLLGRRGNAGCIAKVDQQGNLIWLQDYTYFQSGVSFSSMESIDTSTFLCIGKANSGVTLTKIDDEGHIIWSKELPGMSSATNAIKNGTGEMVFACKALFDITLDLVRIDTAGNLISGNSYDISQPGSNSTEINSITPTNDGGYVIASKNNEAILIKTDSLGVISWVKKYGTGTDHIKQVLQRPEGGYMAVGYTDIYLGICAGNLMRADSAGSTEACEAMFSVSSLSPTVYIDTLSLVGGIANVMPTTEQVIREVQNFDFDDTCHTAWTGVEETSKINFRLFPNPSEGRITIEADREISNIMIYDQIGRMVFQNSLGARVLSFDISNLTPGIYYYKISFKEGNFMNGKLSIK